MIKNFGCQIEKDLAYECERDENGQQTNLKNANRIVYVDEDVKKNPLPRNTFCGNWRCSIFHYGQQKITKQCYNCMPDGHLKWQCENERACRASKKSGHKEGEKECDVYQPNDTGVFQGEKDILSNFNPCDFE